jgi:hypothetical protein
MREDEIGGLLRTADFFYCLLLPRLACAADCFVAFGLRLAVAIAQGRGTPGAYLDASRLGLLSLRENHAEDTVLVARLGRVRRVAGWQLQTASEPPSLVLT